MVVDFGFDVSRSPPLAANKHTDISVTNWLACQPQQSSSCNATIRGQPSNRSSPSDGFSSSTKPQHTSRFSAAYRTSEICCCCACKPEERGHPEPSNDHESQVLSQPSVPTAQTYVKRGRGRPRKAMVQPRDECGNQNVGAAVHEHAVPKRGRGRPRKEDVPSIDEHEIKDSERTDALPSQPHQTSVLGGDMECVAKRGRGRPRRVTDVTIDGTMMNRLSTTTQSAGEPTPSCQVPTSCSVPQSEQFEQNELSSNATNNLSSRPRRRTQRAKHVKLYVNLTPSPHKQSRPKNIGPRDHIAGFLTPTPVKPTGVNYTEILEFFSINTVTSDFIRKHLPPRNLRTSKSFWEPSSSDDVDRVDQRLTVMRYYREVMFAVAKLLCVDDEAAIASLKNFAVWLVPDLANKGHREIVRSCLLAVASAKSRSPELSAIRATLCGTFKYQEIVSLAEHTSYQLSRATYLRSRNEFEILLNRGTLSKPKSSKQKFDPLVVDDAISFVLAYDNVSYLSWGTKSVKLEGKRHDVPSILRKKPVTVIYQQYKQQHTGETLSRTSFFRLCSTLTNGEVESRKAVDYVTGYLVHDPLEALRDIILRSIPHKAKSFMQKLDIVEAWLKYGHASTRESANECPRHDVVFGLELPTQGVAENSRTPSCSSCLGLHTLFSHIQRLVGISNVHESAHRVLVDIKNKFEIFMGHRLRVVNQQRAIATLIEDAKESCRTNRHCDIAVVLIDFKMKAEPRYFREKTADHYGKRGMSWHGVQLRFWNADFDGVGDEQTSPVHENFIYYDQLSSGDNKQDRGAVLSLLEATMMAIKRDLPHIKRIVVQSDNASCYQNAAVMLLLPIIGFAYGIRVTRYEHTETQDGKSPLNGHFGQAGQKVSRYVNERHNCVTPVQYVKALRANGGMPNCVAELVKYNRSLVNNLLQLVSSMDSVISKTISRANDVLYEFPEPSYDATTSFSFQACPSFTMHLYAYSGIGTGNTIQVNPSSLSCTVEHATRTTTTMVNEAIEESVDGSNKNPEPQSDDFVGDVSDLLETEREVWDRDDEHASISLVRSDPTVIAVSVPVDGHDTTRVTPTHGSRPQPQQNRPGLVGCVTGVEIASTAQLVRCARKHVNANTRCDTGQSSMAERDEILSPREKDLIAYCKRRLISLSTGSDFGIVDESLVPDKMSAITSGLDLNDQDNDHSTVPKIKRGWARRLPKGHMYGAKYINPFIDEIGEMFQRGAEESGDKLGAGRMREKLIERHPLRFDIPGENEIRTEISRLYSGSRKRKPANATSRNDQPTKRPRILGEYTQFIEGLLSSTPTLKPLQILAQLREQYPNSAAEISDQQVRTKANSVKQKYKQVVSPEDSEGHR